MSQPISKYFANNKRKVVSSITSASALAKRQQIETEKRLALTLQQGLVAMNSFELEAYLENISKEELECILRQLNEVYRNLERPEELLVSDAMFDRLKEFYETRFDAQFHAVGAVPREGNHQVKVRLSEWMPSLAKAAKEQEFVSLRKKLLAVNAKKTCLSDKVDGQSCRIYCRPGIDAFVYQSHGQEGIYGTDVSHIHFYLQSKIPTLQVLQEAEISSVRCELVMCIADFERLKANPPASLRATNSLSNPRAVLVAAINAKTPDPELLSLISVFAYGICYVDPLHKNARSKHAQMMHLAALGFQVPRPELRSIKYGYDEACQFYLERQKDAPYKMDGIVESAEEYDYDAKAVVEDAFVGPPTQVSFEEMKADKRKLDDPELMFAIKLGHSHRLSRGVETTVIKNHWQVSRYGRLTPVVQVNPVIIDGKTLQNPTGKKAKLIKDHCVSAGSRVLVDFGGDVIPDILEFLSPGTSGKPDFPDWAYHWSETGEHIYCDDLDRSEIRLARAQFLFKTLGCARVGDETIAVLFAHFHEDLNGIFSATPEQLLQLPGFQETKAHNTVESIQNSIRSPTLVDLMYGSCLFQEALGRTRLQDILTTYPDVMDWQVSQRNSHLLVEKLQKIPKLDRLAKQFIDNLTAFQQWLLKHPTLKPKELAAAEQKSSSIPGLPSCIAVTGGMPAEIEAKLKQNGCKIANSVTKAVQMVVAKTLGSNSKKEQDGARLHIPVVSLAQFIKTYQL